MPEVGGVVRGDPADVHGGGRSRARWAAPAGRRCRRDAGRGPRPGTSGISTRGQDAHQLAIHMASSSSAATSGRHISRSGRYGIGLVVAQRGAVEPGGVQSGGLQHPGRRGRVPLPLPAGVDVGVGVAADDRHGLGARRTDPDELDVQPVAEQPQHRRRTVRTGGDADRTRAAGGGAVDGVAAVHLAECGQRHRGVGDRAFGPRGALPERHVHRPVLAAGMENSRVPSSGSMIHTRSACSRCRSSCASSESTASPGRSARRRRSNRALARTSPASPRAGGKSWPTSSRTASSSRPASSARSAASSASVRLTPPVSPNRGRRPQAPLRGVDSDCHPSLRTPCVTCGSRALLALAGCGKADGRRSVDRHDLAVAEHRVDGTEEQPTTTIDDPSQYTVSSATTAGRGSRWTATAVTPAGRPSAAAPDSGTLTFGPIALTRMMCPQPSADTKVAAALGCVRSYLLSDGELHLSMRGRQRHHALGAGRRLIFVGG